MPKLRALAAVALASALPFAVQAKKVDITTYHYDNYRTGWNSHEKKLTAASVAGNKFGLIATTPLDDQVDAQPLILAKQAVGTNSAREVVYIATESNTVYAIDANTGEVLLQRNLGNPVPRDTLPGQCTNGGPNLGINATPVIDPKSRLMYLITYTYESQKPVYRVHALNPSTLDDALEPRVISASGKLADNSTYNFDPHESRQRAGLLLNGGNLYAGFASFCDYEANKSRGWILGWSAKNLKPLKANDLTNKLNHTEHNFFLTAIWMSGYGLAGSQSGDVYFVTGNSDWGGNAYDPVLNISESVAQMSSDLKTVKHLFTPANVVDLEKNDGDFGSGGFMLLPPQKNQPSNLAVASGKDPVMYLFNADDISNGAGGGGAAYGTAHVDPCWCGPSYYVGSDGKSRIVTSGGNSLVTFTLKASGTPKLTLDKNVGSVEEGVFFPGFFTSVSSNGTKAGTAVIWAVGRPTDFDEEALKLHAFDPEQGKEIFATTTGYWTNSWGDDNIVPVAANGKVYVATVQSLAIYGLKKNGAAFASLLPAPKRIDVRPKLAPGEHEIRGTVRGIAGNLLTVELRDGKTLTVDATKAIKGYMVAAPSIGHALLARGAYRGDVLEAAVLGHAPDHPAVWPADR
ncbi:MAG TPA: hypothetical protein VG889_02425 [Rhizomicrobium sp.]|nr:hypothetical protein [Rhizomicrobium sp.]